MKFNFEKNLPKEEPKLGEIKIEKTQEEYEAEIIAEAEKLSINLAQLKAEIGDPEKFKENFEKGTEWSGRDAILDNQNAVRNKAGDKLRAFRCEASGSKNTAKIMGKITAICYGLSALLVAAGIHEGGASVVGADVTASLMFILGSVSLIDSIKGKLASRKINRIMQKEELKFKMTDTEVK